MRDSTREERRRATTYLEPINRAAVNERGILSQSNTESVSNRTERDEDMEVLTTAIDKEGEQRQWGELSHLVPALSDRAHRLQAETRINDT